MEPAISSEKQALSQPPLILKPIIDDVASVSSLAYHTLRGLDLTSITTTISTGSLELILKTFVSLIETRNAERVRGPSR